MNMKVGDKVRWHWGSGTATGTVKEVIPESVARSLKGAEITRHGTPENPALFIEQEDGDGVLKLASEMEPAR
jgi:hypothetical protein